MTVARELSKQFETIVTAPLAQIVSALNTSGPVRGEFVVLLHARALADEEPLADDGHDRMLTILLEKLSVTDAVAVAMQLTQAPRNTLYKRALLLKNSTSAA